MFCRLALILFLLMPLLSLASSPPNPSKSEYLVTDAGGFLVKRGEGVVYSLTFSLREQFSSPTYATISFENPSDRKSPLVLFQTIEPSQNELIAESPVIKKIKNGKKYKVEVLLFADEARTEHIGTHKQKLLFNMPADVLKTFGVELL